jgi:hypothetical protein
VDCLHLTQLLSTAWPGIRGRWDRKSRSTAPGIGFGGCEN